MGAALELYCKRGYGESTAAKIAAKAGVMERSFFRHFPPTSERCYSTVTLLSAEASTNAVRQASPALGTWNMLFSPQCGEGDGC